MVQRSQLNGMAEKEGCQIKTQCEGVMAINIENEFPLKKENTVILLILGLYFFLQLAANLYTLILFTNKNK